MQCNICGKKKATVHLTEIVDEQMSEMHLCEDCARQKSTQMEQQFGLADLLAGLSEAGPKGSAKPEEKSTLQCASCGLNYEDFRKFGRLGCGDCYVSFKDNLAGLLRKIHGSNRHLGKTPFSGQAQGAPDGAQIPAAAGSLVQESIEDIKKQMQAAIRDEDFEKAAMLRDKLRTMERERP